MGNLGFQIKRFLSNKNTVTILGAVLVVLILYFGYNWRVQQAINPVRVPYAKVTIQPRTRITEDMIGYTDVPPAMIRGKIVQDANLIVGKWSNYNTLIPAGSLFFQDSLITAAELPDAAFVNIPTGYTAIDLPVTTASTYGNSIFPNNYVDLYFKALNPDGKVIIGKLIENVKILAVKDSDGRPVFENSSEARTPAIIIFAVPNTSEDDMFILLRKAMYLENVKEISADLIPVPTTESYSTEPGSIKMTSQFLKTFIEVNTGTIEEDQLPDVSGNNTNNTTDNNTTNQ